MKWNIDRQPFAKGGLGSRDFTILMRLFLASGYGGLCLRKRSYEEPWSRPNMGWKVLIRFQVSKMAVTVLIFRSLLLENGKDFSRALLLMCAMAPPSFISIHDGAMVFL